MKIVGMILLMMATLGWAEPMDRIGPYVSLGGGYATFYDDKRMQERVEPSYNINLIGGVFINKYLSVELAYDYYNTFTTASQVNTTRIYIVDAAAKAHYSFWRERIDLYAAFGAGGIFWRESLAGVSQEDNSGSIRGDAGVGFRALEWLTLNLGYRRYFFTLEHDTGTKDALENIIYDTYNMEIGSAYANIEVLF